MTVLDFVIYFDISALLISVVLLIALYYRKNNTSFKSKVFSYLVWTCGFASLADMLAGIVNSYEGWMTCKWLLNMFYYMLHSATAFLSVMYFIVMAEPMVRMSSKRKLQLFLPIALEFVAVSFNPLLKIFFYFDENGSYQRGNFMWICYAVYMYYYLYLIIFVIRRTDFFDRLTQIVVIGSSTVYIVPLIIQMRYPALLVECFAATLFVVVVYVVYQTNDNSMDSTTQLLSLQAFESDCKAYVSTNLNFSVLMIKLRDAKFISEVFGGQFCSKVYQAFASFISKYVRFGNAYCFGGGVFALCFINENTEPRLVMDSLAERMQEPWGFEEMTTKLSVSMSIISFPKHASDYTSFIEVAETVFSGEEKSVIYADDVAVKDRRRRADIEKSLTSDKVSQDIEIFYQPIFSEKERRFTSVEALVRLKDPVLGYILPDEFIPIAERNGTMILLGEYIFESVCQFISGGKLDELGIGFVAVNLSVMQCMQTDLVSEIASIMQKYNVNPSQICFEITDLSAGNLPDMMMNNINDLHRLGISFALDNYGAGSSELQRIMLMPVRFIKFDGEFIRRALGSDRDIILLKSSMFMSKSINLKIVAEGVENEEIARQVKELGFDYYQGFYIAPVCKAAEAAHKIKVLNSGLSADRTAKASKS